MDRVSELREHLKKLRAQKEGMVRSKKRAEDQIKDAHKILATLEKDEPTLDGYIAGTLKQLQAFGDQEKQDKVKRLDALRAEIALLES